MTFESDANLLRFARYAGFSIDLLAGGDRYWIENAPADFIGQVEAIRITEAGRFGNIFYQLLHAVMLGRQLHCHTIIAFPFPGCPDAPEVELEGLRFVFHPRAAPPRPPVPTLAGNFFNSYPFQSALQYLPPFVVWRTIQTTLKPLFHKMLAAAPWGSPQTLVMSFRAGDIFTADPVHPWYVQPPASFYTMAADFARAELGVRDVRLVFADRGNPTIEVVEAELTARGIPFTVQSASFQEDFVCLAGATHLVVPFSTFGEVAAMLSDRTETYFAFRTFEAHQHIHWRADPLMLGVLRQKGVRAILIDDPQRDYIPAMGWRRSPEQLLLMRTFPASSLRISEGAAADRLERACAEPRLQEQVVEARREAAHIRQAMIALRLEAANAERGLRAVRDALEAELQKCAQLDAMLLETRQDCVQLDAMLRECRQQADRLRALAEDWEARFHHLDQAMHQSTSWRVTAPLRAATRLARRLRG